MTQNEYNNLDTAELYKLSEEYSKYIKNFDYDTCDKPVSLQKFYKTEYQRILLGDVNTVTVKILNYEKGIVDTKEIYVPTNIEDDTDYIDGYLYDEYGPGEIAWMVQEIDPTCKTCRKEYSIECQVRMAINNYDNTPIVYPTGLTCDKWEKYE